MGGAEKPSRSFSRSPPPHHFSRARQRIAKSLGGDSCIVRCTDTAWDTAFESVFGNPLSTHESTTDHSPRHLEENGMNSFGVRTSSKAFPRRSKFALVQGRRSRGAEALAALPDEHAPGGAPHFDAPLRIGTRVEAKFHAARGGTGWFEGTVVSCHEDERYDIDYDDGDFEARVLRKHIKLLEAQSQAADSLPSAPVAKRKAALTELTPQQHQQQKQQRTRSKADTSKVTLEDDSPAPNYKAAETLRRRQRRLTPMQRLLWQHLRKFRS